MRGVGNLSPLRPGSHCSEPPIPYERRTWLSFVRNACRILRPPAFREMAPDLVVEVLSPDDRPGETLAKVGDSLEAGARLAWVIDPQRRLARIYGADGTESLLAESDALDGEDVLPGFSCPLASIL